MVAAHPTDRPAPGTDPASEARWQQAKSNSDMTLAFGVAVAGGGAIGTSATSASGAAFQFGRAVAMNPAKTTVGFLTASYTDEVINAIGGAAGSPQDIVPSNSPGVGPTFKRMSDDAFVFDLPGVNISSNTQLLGRPASSTILGKNLRRTGEEGAQNYAAHHIVAGKAKRAQEARAILEREGIDINDASNGVWLPSSSKHASGVLIPHSRIHTHKYYRSINRRLGSASDVKSELHAIKTEISNGTFKYK